MRIKNFCRSKHNNIIFYSGLPIRRKKNCPLKLSSRKTLPQTTYFSCLLFVVDVPHMHLLAASIFFHCCSVIVVPPFPLYSPLPCPTPAPEDNPQSIVLVHEPFVHVPWLDPSPSSLHDPPITSPPITVSLFFISMSLVLFCLLVSFAD